MPPPFHAGGAANLRLFDPGSIGQLKKMLIARLSELDLTRFGTIVALLGVIPAAWRTSYHVWQEAGTWIKQWFISSVTIPASDPLNRSTSMWLLENIVQPRQLRFLTARTEISHDQDPGSSLKKSQRSVQYFPRWENLWFWHGKNWFTVHRSIDSFHSFMADATYDGIGGEELTISCLGRSSSPIKTLLSICREFGDRKAQFYVIIYSRDRYGMSWKPKYRKPLRRLETVHFDDNMKQALLTDVRTYLDPRTRELYQSRSMPYRRGYLFCGPPGTGKSSLSTALAGEFGLDIYEVKIPSIANDADLEQMFQEIPPRCIVLLEDIDAVWTHQRMERPTNDNDSDKSSVQSAVTLSGLLNVLDGVGSQEGRIVIMTTNKPEQLDRALTRPGRIDFKLFMGNISRQSAEQMFLRMFAPDLVSWTPSCSEKPDSTGGHISLEQLKMLAASFAEQIPEDTLTPSQLQGFFQLHLDNVMLAVSSIADWVKSECAEKSSND